MRPSGRTSTHAGRHTPTASLSSMRSSTVSGASSGWPVELIVAAGRRRCKGVEPSRAWSAAPRPSSIELIVADEALRRGGCGDELCRAGGPEAEARARRAWPGLDGAVSVPSRIISLFAGEGVVVASAEGAGVTLRSPPALLSPSARSVSRASRAEGSNAADVSEV